MTRVLLHYVELSTTRKVIFLTSSKTPCLSLYLQSKINNSFLTAVRLAVQPHPTSLRPQASLPIS